MANETTQTVQDMATGEGLTRIYSPSNDPAQRIPGTIIKPVVERIESFLSQELCCTKIEVAIKNKCMCVWTYIHSLCMKSVIIICITCI